MKPLTIRVSPRLAALVALIAEREFRSVSQQSEYWINRCVQEYLDVHPWLENELPAEIQNGMPSRPEP
jgi:hypothetical protein